MWQSSVYPPVLFIPVFVDWMKKNKVKKKKKVENIEGGEYFFYRHYLSQYVSASWGSTFMMVSHSPHDVDCALSGRAVVSRIHLINCPHRMKYEQSPDDPHGCFGHLWHAATHKYSVVYFIPYLARESGKVWGPLRGIWFLETYCVINTPSILTRMVFSSRIESAAWSYLDHVTSLSLW